MVVKGQPEGLILRLREVRKTVWYRVPSTSMRRVMNDSRKIW